MTIRGPVLPRDGFNPGRLSGHVNYMRSRSQDSGVPALALSLDQGSLTRNWWKPPLVKYERQF